MSKLKEAGFIFCSPKGVYNTYELNYEKFDLPKKYFMDLINEVEYWKNKKIDCVDDTGYCSGLNIRLIEHK